MCYGPYSSGKFQIFLCTFLLIFFVNGEPSMMMKIMHSLTHDHNMEDHKVDMARSEIATKHKKTTKNKQQRINNSE